MSKPEHDPSIEHEPHLRGGGFTPDPSAPAARRTVRDAIQNQSDDDRVEHTVWDEPALSRDLAGQTPTDGLTYADWLGQRIVETSAGRSWSIAAVIAIAAGPWAIVGALFGGNQSTFGVVMITVFGPVMEEMMKVAAVLWVVEKRPFLFRSRVQIALCVLAGALVFAAVENVLYLNVFVRNPPVLLIRWRWTVCVALHMGCSFTAGLGLMKIWRSTIENRTRPQLTSGAAYMVTAIVIHGVYNGFAVLMSMVEFQF